VSRYQKGKTNLDFTEATDSEWQWHQLGRMRLHLAPDRKPCQYPTTQSFTGRMPFLPPNQQRQSTEGTNNNDNTHLMASFSGQHAVSHMLDFNEARDNTVALKSTGQYANYLHLTSDR